MGEVEVEAFLDDLAVNRHVAALTQTQALNAIVFLYGDVLLGFHSTEGLQEGGEPGGLTQTREHRAIMKLMDPLGQIEGAAIFRRPALEFRP